MYKTAVCLEQKTMFVGFVRWSNIRQIVQTTERGLKFKCEYNVNIVQTLYLPRGEPRLSSSRWGWSGKVRPYEFPRARSSRCCTVSNYYNCNKRRLTCAMKQSMGLSAPSLTVLFLQCFSHFFLFRSSVCLTTWKDDFPAKYSYPPPKVGESDQWDPWCCQKERGCSTVCCVHVQKYFIAYIARWDCGKRRNVCF